MDGKWISYELLYSTIIIIHYTADYDNLGKCKLMLNKKYHL